MELSIENRKSFEDLEQKIQYVINYVEAAYKQTKDPFIAEMLKVISSNLLDVEKNNLRDILHLLEECEKNKSWNPYNAGTVLLSSPTPNKEVIESSSNIEYKYFPKNREDFKNIINNLIRERGNDGDFNDIYTGDTTDMHNLFWRKKDFNGDISKWDVSNVEDMSGMFDHCSRFNRDLSKWDVRSVKNSTNMFVGCDQMLDKNKPINTNTMEVLGK